ncbi:MAG: translation elongation factor-like protein [Candidatus Micrarchaeota archaeon]|nr:translation elongation factor-like protein [Candidatus Micrarchaeota archaeon]
MEKKQIGRVLHYFSKISVAVIELSDALNAGDRISIEGAHDAVEQVVDSMQIEHATVKNAKAGQSIGLKVAGKVHENSVVYKVTG